VVNAVYGQCLLILHGQNLKSGVAADLAAAHVAANKVVNQAVLEHMLVRQSGSLRVRHLRSAQAVQLAAIVHVKHLLDSRHTHVMQVQLRVHYVYAHQVALADLPNALLCYKAVITVLLVFAVRLADTILQFADQLVQVTTQVADLTRGTLHLNQHMLAVE
jgi:hypothetical protein